MFDGVYSEIGLTHKSEKNVSHKTCAFSYKSFATLQFFELTLLRSPSGCLPASLSNDE